MGEELGRSVEVVLPADADGAVRVSPRCVHDRADDVGAVCSVLDDRCAVEESSSEPLVERVPAQLPRVSIFFC